LLRGDERSRGRANVAEANTVHLDVRNGTGQSVEFEPIEVPSDENTIKSYVIIFKRPFMEGEQFTIIQEEKISMVMNPLLTDGGDYLASTISYAPYAEKVELRLATPGSFPNLTQENGSREALRTLKGALDPIVRELNQNPIQGERSDAEIRAAPPGYKHYAWSGGRCERNQCLRVVYRIQHIP
jgi:hypothetical protein